MTVVRKNAFAKCVNTKPINKKQNTVHLYNLHHSSVTHPEQNASTYDSLAKNPSTSHPV